MPDYQVGFVFEQGQEEFRSCLLYANDAVRMLKTAEPDNYHEVTLYVKVGSKTVGIPFSDLPDLDGGSVSHTMLKHMAAEKLRKISI